MAINEKRKRFAQEYIIDSNGSAAAIRAGYGASRARITASELLDKPEVIAYVQELREERAKRCEITADDVLRQIALVAFSDPRKVMAWGPGGVKLRESSELTDEEAAIVAEVSETVTQSGGNMRLKIHDKMKALELIGKHLGMFTDKIDHTSSDGSMTPTVIERRIVDNTRD